MPLLCVILSLPERGIGDSGPRNPPLQCPVIALAFEGKRVFTFFVGEAEELRYFFICEIAFSALISANLSLSLEVKNLIRF